MLSQFGHNQGPKPTRFQRGPRTRRPATTRTPAPTEGLGTCNSEAPFEMSSPVRQHRDSPPIEVGYTSSSAQESTEGAVTIEDSTNPPRGCALLNPLANEWTPHATHGTREKALLTYKYFLSSERSGLITRESSQDSFNHEGQCRAVRSTDTNESK